MSLEFDGLRKRWKVARRELKSLSSEKTIVLAIAIQLFIAGFSSFLVVGLVSMYNPDSVSSNAVSIGVTGNASDEIERVANESGVDIQEFDSYSSAIDRFNDGGIQGVISGNWTQKGGVNVNAVVPESGIETTLTVVKVKDVLVRLERSVREQFSSQLDRMPLDLPPESDSSPYYSFTYTLLIPLLMFLPVFISGTVVADSITEEYERNTLDLLRVTPLSFREIMEGKMLAMMALAPVQAAVWLVLLMFNGTWIYRPLLLIAVVSTLSVLVVSFGALVSLSFRNRQKSQFVYSLGVIVGLAVASALPESLPNTMAKLAIGSTTPSSYIAIIGYVILAALTWIIVSKKLIR